MEGNVGGAYCSDKERECEENRQSQEQTVTFKSIHNPEHAWVCTSKDERALAATSRCPEYGASPGVLPYQHPGQGTLQIDKRTYLLLLGETRSQRASLDKMVGQYGGSQPIHCEEDW